MAEGYGSIDVGYWIAVTLAKDTAPLRSYVGQVESVDEHGIRLTLIDWISGEASGFDFFVPWSHLQSALIATPQHNMEHFSAEARKWQEAINTSPHSP